MPGTDSTTASVAVIASAGGTEVAAALTTTVDCAFADGALADPEGFVRALPAEFGAERESPNGASGVAPSCATSDCACSAEGAGATGCSTGDAGLGDSAADCSLGDSAADCSLGDSAADCSLGDAAVLCWVDNAAAGCSAGGSAVSCSAGAAVAAEGAPVWLGCTSLDAVLSLFDGVDAARAPPEFCTTPERGSDVEALLDEDVGLAAWESTELCAVPDVESDEDPAAEADDSVDELADVDDVLAADSDDELEVDDDEPDVELEELVSVGSANATAGVLATAAPTPSSNARTPARTMDCGSTGITAGGQPAQAPARCPPEPT